MCIKAHYACIKRVIQTQKYLHMESWEAIHTHVHDKEDYYLPPFSIRVAFITLQEAFSIFDKLDVRRA